jgi:hypothetical protein
MQQSRDGLAEQLDCHVDPTDASQVRRARAAACCPDRRMCSDAYMRWLAKLLQPREGLVVQLNCHAEVSGASQVWLCVSVFPRLRAQLALISCRPGQYTT